MQSCVENDVLLYHHSLISGATLWDVIKKLRLEIYKPESIRILASGEWSHLILAVLLKKIYNCPCRI